MAQVTPLGWLGAGDTRSGWASAPSTANGSTKPARYEGSSRNHTGIPGNTASRCDTDRTNQGTPGSDDERLAEVVRELAERDRRGEFRSIEDARAALEGLL